MPKGVDETPQWGFRQCLPFSWTTLRGKHCRHPIAVLMGVVDTFERWQQTQRQRHAATRTRRSCLSKISGSDPDFTNEKLVEDSDWALLL